MHWSLHRSNRQVAYLTVTRAKAAFLSSEVASCMLHWSTGRFPCPKQLTCDIMASSSQSWRSKNKDSPRASSYQRWQRLKHAGHLFPGPQHCCYWKCLQLHWPPFSWATTSTKSDTPERNLHRTSRCQGHTPSHNTALQPRLSGFDSSPHARRGTQTPETTLRSTLAVAVAHCNSGHTEV